MSWGERSCKSDGEPYVPIKCIEEGICTPSNCNVDCKYYKWDGKTKPDSKPNSVSMEEFFGGIGNMKKCPVCKGNILKCRCLEKISNEILKKVSGDEE